MAELRHRLYYYVGPAHIKARGDIGTPIRSLFDFGTWFKDHDCATFVIDDSMVLRLADRRSEHISCSGGRPVYSAGEMFFEDGCIVEVSNQSVGFITVE